MELNLSPVQKQQALEASESSMTYEIFTLLIRLGVDPDEFTEADIPSLETTAMAGEVNRLKSLVASLSIVKAKLAAL